MGKKDKKDDENDHPRESLKMTFKLNSSEFENSDEKHKKKKKKKRKSDEDRSEKKERKKMKKEKKDKMRERSQDSEDFTDSPKKSPKIKTPPRKTPEKPRKPHHSGGAGDQPQVPRETQKSKREKQNLLILSMIIEKMLKYLVCNFQLWPQELEKFDPQGIFSHPVTDDIAPGYFSIVRYPMDFSTIRKKLNRLEYLSLYSVRNDLELMCRNLDTPYHVLALKMIKEIKRVTTIKRATKFMKRDDIALDRIYRILAKSREMEKEIESGSESDDDSSNENRGNSPRVKREWAPEKLSTMDLTDPNLESAESASHTDPIGPEDVLRSALRAAAEARARLQAKYPKPCRMGFLKFDQESTLFNTINDGSGEQETLQVYPLNIEDPVQKENISAVEYLRYGPFGNYLPTFDNRLADLSETKWKSKEKSNEDKKELSRLLTIYGGDKEILYVQSLQKFVADMGPEVIEAVEVVLNRLTDGLHETTRLNKREIRDIKIDPESLATLKDLGVDTSFLEAFDPNSQACKKASFINKTLQEAAELMITINNEILAEDLTDDRRMTIKQKVAVLNSMLKKMIPLYGRPDHSAPIRREEIKTEQTHHQRPLLIAKEEPPE